MAEPIPTLPILEWIPPRREFERQITPHSRLRCRFQQRSDGILYFMTWELIHPMDAVQSEPRRREIEHERQLNREQQWQSFLSNIPSERAKPIPLGWLVDNDPTYGAWQEMKLEIGPGPGPGPVGDHPAAGSAPLL